MSLKTVFLNKILLLVVTCFILCLPVKGYAVVLGLGDTVKYSVVASGETLQVPEGATGCNIWNVGIRGTLDLDEAIGDDTLGAEKVTDGAFDAVTETNVYTSDFSATVDGWGGARVTITANVDDIPDAAGYDDVLRIVCTDVTNNTHWAGKGTTWTIGLTYKVSLEYYIPSGQSNIDGISIGDGAVAGTPAQGTLGAWTAYTCHIKPASTQIYVFATDGGSVVFQDAGGDDIFYIKNVVVDNTTATNWTAGTGWAPQVVSFALTGKMGKVAGTASDLEQDISAEALKLYKNTYTATRTAGTLTPQIGAVDGAAISASNTYTDYIAASTTGNLKFQADAAFAGTVDVSTAKEVTSLDGIYNTWATTVDLAGIGAGEIVRFYNSGFIQSQATIVATLGASGTAMFDADCQFSIGTTGFRNYASDNFILTAGSALKNAGDNTPHDGTADVTDLAGRAITDGSGNIIVPGGVVDIGPYELFVSGGRSMSMGMGLKGGFAPHRPDD